MVRGRVLVAALCLAATSVLLAACGERGGEPAGPAAAKGSLASPPSVAGSAPTAGSPPAAPVSLPVFPPPDSLWQAPADSLPAVGGYIYLESDLGDPVGGGERVILQQADGDAFATQFGRELRIAALVGGRSTFGDFLGMDSLSQLAPGYYDGVSGWPTYDTSRGGMTWSLDGRSCTDLSGWFSIDTLVVADGQLRAAAFRFEQRCQGAAGALRGQVFWMPAPTPLVPGPANPPPPGLWRAPDGLTPLGGNYVYLEAEAGDWVGAGGTLEKAAQSYLYTPRDSVITMAAYPLALGIRIDADEHWTGNFTPMALLSRLQPGYYSRLDQAQEGSMTWSGEGRGCAPNTGWYAIDAIDWSGDTLTYLDLRFEQHCQGALPALRGQVHWDAADTTAPPGPVSPPPAGLWDIPAGVAPATGNYVYLQSDPGDLAFSGLTTLDTQMNSLMAMSFRGSGLSMSVWGDHYWNGEFQPMRNTFVQPGFYPDLRNSNPAIFNPARGGSSWDGGQDSRSWVVIDRVEVAPDGSLGALDLRFEQAYFEGATPKLHGKVHWVAGDPARPPGPLSPPPPGLWDAPAGSTPVTGSYVYLASSLGDRVGLGLTYLYTRASAAVTMTANQTLTINISGDRRWTGNFRAEYGGPGLQVGLYEPVIGLNWNPTKGQLSWSGDATGCNDVSGWFVVDSVTWGAGGAPDAFDIRFEQHCEGIIPALRGKIHWEPGG